MNYYRLIVIAVLSGVHSFIVCSGYETTSVIPEFSCLNMKAKLHPWESEETPDENRIKNARHAIDRMMREQPLLRVDGVFMHSSQREETGVSIVGIVDAANQVQSLHVVFGSANQARLIVTSGPGEGAWFRLKNYLLLFTTLNRLAIDKGQASSLLHKDDEVNGNIFKEQGNFSENDHKIIKSLFDPDYCDHDGCFQFLPCSGLDHDSD